MTAPEPGCAAAPTPGQAAFDAFWASPALGAEPPSPLERESPGIRAAWKAAAQAGSAAAHARIAELEAELAGARSLLGAIREFAWSWTEPDGAGELAAQIVALVDAAQPAPTPVDHYPCGCPATGHVGRCGAMP